jgi:hypothetical protein
MAAKKREIYARFGVQLITNERSFVAGPDAMGVYAFCVMWTRKEQRDGFVPELVALSAWGGERKENAKRLDRLVGCGYLERVDGGFRVAKYEEHNDTVADIETAREAARLRKDKSRHTSGHGDVTRDGRVSHAEVPISISISPSGSGSSSSGEGLGEGPPPWFGEAAKTVGDGTGREVTDLHGRWLEYRASRERKNWAMNPRDAIGWLTAVMRTEARQPKAKADTRQPLRNPEDAEWLKASGGDL